MADEARRVLDANLGDQRVRQYVRFLADALLVRVIDPLEIRLKKRRGAAKLCLVDHALRASWLHEIVPLVPRDLDAAPAAGTPAGHLAESITGATLSTIPGLDIAHLPARGSTTEIDFILTVGDRRIPLEVKYQATIDPVRDTAGLRRFVEREVNRAPFGVLVTRDDVTLDLPAGIVALPLASLMLLR